MNKLYRIPEPEILKKRKKYLINQYIINNDKENEDYENVKGWNIRIKNDLGQSKTISSIS